MVMWYLNDDFKNNKFEKDQSWVWKFIVLFEIDVQIVWSNDYLEMDDEINELIIFSITIISFVIEKYLIVLLRL